MFSVISLGRKGYGSVDNAMQHTFAYNKCTRTTGQVGVIEDETRSKTGPPYGTPLDLFRGEDTVVTYSHPAR